MLVLQAITGPDAGDASSVPSRLDFDAAAPVAGLKVGYVAQWMKESPATDVDRAAMETMKKLGMSLKEVDAARLAVQLADADPVRRRRGVVRGAGARTTSSARSRCR